MLRYHFNVHDGRDIMDQDGTELPNLQTAKLEAIRLAGHLIASDADGIHEDWWLDVCDTRGLVLFRLHFAVIASAATEA